MLSVDGMFTALAQGDRHLYAQPIFIDTAYTDFNSLGDIDTDLELPCEEFDYENSVSFQSSSVHRSNCISDYTSSQSYGRI